MVNNDHVPADVTCDDDWWVAVDEDRDPRIPPGEYQTVVVKVKKILVRWLEAGVHFRDS